MKWFIPSWNGDIRVIPHPDNPRWSQVVVHKPTAYELRILDRLSKKFRPFWIGPAPRLWDPNGDTEKQVSDLKSPVSKVGTAVSRLYKAGEQTLTKFVIGKEILIAEGSGEELGVAAEVADKVEQKQEAEGKKPDAKAASVKRPTPCCPQCIPGAIEPATEVLLAFLTPAQHLEWAQERCITVVGNLSGHRYLLAHRNTPLAQEWGRICYDMDADVVLHFHDWTVPPEEEVLAAKLILEHREHWLRHEATLLGDGYGSRRVDVRADAYKNPFGDGRDGVADATGMAQLGREIAKFLGVKLPTDAGVYYSGGNPPAQQMWSVSAAYSPDTGVTPLVTNTTSGNAAVYNGSGWTLGSSPVVYSTNPADAQGIVI